MTELRDLLAQRVADTRREADRAGAPVGRWTPLEDVRTIHLTTTGRRTGRPHEKLWLPFAPWGEVLYLLEERGADAGWVRNLLADPVVQVREIGAATARLVVGDEEQHAREVCERRFTRRGLLVADLVETGLVIAFE